MAFHEKLFGQHLVVDIVSKAIYQHVFTDSPEKALVLSFHGSTGTGKTYVSEIITDHLYLMGRRSKFVVKKLSVRDYPDEKLTDKYKKELQTLIEEQTKSCERSLFIFDHMELMPKGLVNVIRPYLEYYRNFHGLDYRKNIFIFLSNLGAEEINTETYNHLKSGKKREEITIAQMEKSILNALSRQSGGFEDAVLVKYALIDFFVPFLPLEKQHVKQCVEESMKELQKHIPKYKGKPLTKELKEFIVTEVVDWLQFDDMFAKTGCYTVRQAILQIF